jgi:hypothetical protein
MEEKAEIPTLRRIAQRAVEVVPGCDCSGISMRRRRRRVETVASTSAVAEACDAVQYALDEGPCLDAIWDDACYLTEDTRNDARWPRWGPRVAEHGVGSVLSIRLATSTETLGALNLYAERVNGFTTDDVDLALIYAQHATNAVSVALLVSGLEAAVDSRHDIGVAQGILMHKYGITKEQSFEVLRRFSSHTNVKLREVAAHVVQAGDLPAKSPEPAILDAHRPSATAATRRSSTSLS